MRSFSERRPGPWSETGDGFLGAIGYVVIAVAVFDVAKYFIQEEVIRGREMRVASEARRSLTKFISTISIAVFIEALVIVVQVSKQDVGQMLFPTLLLLTAVLIVIGLGIYQRLSVAVEQQDKGATGKSVRRPLTFLGVLYVAAANSHVVLVNRDFTSSVRTSANSTGMTISVSSVEVTMPPIIGTAMRCMISDPVPWLQRIGRRPAMMAADRHHFRAHALDGAFHDGGVKIGPAQGGGPRRPRRPAAPSTPAGDRSASRRRSPPPRRRAQ